MQSSSSWHFSLLLRPEFVCWNLWLYISMVTLEEGREGCPGKKCYKKENNIKLRKTTNGGKKKKKKELQHLLEETRPTQKTPIHGQIWKKKKKLKHILNAGSEHPYSG